MPVLYDVGPCSVLHTDRCISLYHLDHLPDDWNNKLLCNIGQFLSDYKAQHLIKYFHTLYSICKFFVLYYDTPASD
jgi:hypothetical protein